MSNTQFIFIRKKNVPERAALQAAIEKLGFDLILDTDLNLIDDEGFSPCILGGEEDIGFEIYYELASEVVEEESFENIAGDNDSCISLCWGGSMKDCAAVMIVSAALAKNFGATVSYEGEEPEDPEKLMSSASQAIKEVAIQAEREAISKRELERAIKHGKPEQLIKQKLKEIEGTSVTGMGLGGMLMIGFSNGSRLTAKAFGCITQEGEVIEVSHYPRVRVAQMRMIDATIGSTPTKEQESKLNELESKLDEAAEQDEKEAQRFNDEVESWPEELYVSKVEWTETNNTIRLRFDNVPKVALVMRALDSFVADISFDTKHLGFKLTNDRCEIRR